MLVRRRRGYFELVDQMQCACEMGLVSAGVLRQVSLLYLQVWPSLTLCCISATLHIPFHSSLSLCFLLLLSPLLFDLLCIHEIECVWVRSHISCHQDISLFNYVYIQSVHSAQPYIDDQGIYLDNGLRSTHSYLSYFKGEW